MKMAEKTLFLLLSFFFLFMNSSCTSIRTSLSSRMITTDKYGGYGEDNNTFDQLRDDSSSTYVFSLSVGSAIRYDSAFMDSVRTIVESLSLAEKAGQMLLSYPPSPSFARRYCIGGVVVNQLHHITSKNHMTALSSSYSDSMLIPMLIACDQEGGKINRLKNIPGFETTPSALNMGRLPSDSIFVQAIRTAETMKEMGIDTNLAPCLDVASNPDALQRRMERVFSGSADTVAQCGMVFAAGFRKGDVAVIAKHFPGYGEEKWNSDVSLVRYDVDVRRFVRDLMVFVKVSPLIDGVMMSSLIYPDFGNDPACLTPELVSLAHDIVPEGIVVTDDLWAPALRQYVRKDYESVFTDEDFAVITRKAFIAGNDMLLILDHRRVPEMIETLSNLVENNPGFEERMNRSVERIIALKASLHPELLARLHSSLESSN